VDVLLIAVVTVTANEYCTVEKTYITVFLQKLCLLLLCVRLLIEFLVSCTVTHTRTWGTQLLVLVLVLNPKVLVLILETGILETPNGIHCTLGARVLVQC